MGWALGWAVVCITGLLAYVCTPAIHTIPSRAQAGFEYAIVSLVAILRRVVGAEDVAYMLVPTLGTVGIFAFLQGALSALHVFSAATYFGHVLLALYGVVLLCCIVVRVYTMQKEMHSSALYGVAGYIAVLLRHGMAVVRSGRKHWRIVLLGGAVFLGAPLLTLGHTGIAVPLALLFAQVCAAVYGSLGIVALVCGKVQHT